MEKFRHKRNKHIINGLYLCFVITVVLSLDFANMPPLATDFASGGALLPKMKKMRLNRTYADNQSVTICNS